MNFQASRSSSRIVISTFGSLGDLHPCIALALGLRERGHVPVIATSGLYREKIEALGIEFAAIRPDFPDPATDQQFMRRVMDLKKGPEVVVKQTFMPILRENYADLFAASEGADFLISHSLTFSVSMVAEKRGIPWASLILAPVSFFSPHDPPVLAPAPWLTALRPFGPRVYGPLLKALKGSIRSWSEPYHAFRRELGLAPAADPMFEGQFSPHLVLAMFSDIIGTRQPDWPSETVIAGFPFYDHHDAAGLSPALAEFLDSGEPPIVFTLGSAAVFNAGRFY